jgi:exodeoxyribonuclease V alpha subunit
MHTDTITTISGKIERIIYESPENAYLVAIVSNPRRSITVCGIMPNAQKGEKVEFSGDWKKHPEHGDQFVFKSYSVPVPQTETEIKGFLECLNGIGTATAEKMVFAFGEDTLKVIEEDPEALLSIQGITENKLENIISSYSEKCGMQRLISFLHGLDISATYASKIHKKYGSGAIVTIKTNPYILSKEVRGIGFASADKIALALGIPKDSPLRIQAATIHALKEASQMHGHCFLQKNQLCYTVQKLLYLPSYKIETEAIVKLIDHLSQEHISPSKRFVQDKGVYHASIYNAEVGVAGKIINLVGSYESDKKAVEEWISDYEIESGMVLSDGQKKVIRLATVNGITVVTGGAGVGKSTAMNAVVQFWDDCNFTIVAAAPTGKAAQRIKELSGIATASTIHRLLNWSDGEFTYNSENLIEADAVLIDEFSMVDIKLAWALFQAIPPHAVVVIIGDANQLPAIGPGNVLKDIIASKAVPVVELTEIFRQAKHSKIIQASQAIVRGEFPILDVFDRDIMTEIEPSAEAVWIPCESSQIKSTIKWLLESGLPHYQKENIQLLSPVHKGECGNIALNELAQEIWNPYRGQPEMLHFRMGDRVIQTLNDYNRQIFNGDIGLVERIDKENSCLFVRFTDLDNRWRSVKYSYSDLEYLMLAYSISVHKSQGSEFPVVIMPITTQHYIMLQRNILYTGFTRGKRLVILVGDKRAIDIAVKTQKGDRRNTNLADRLK